MKPTKMVTVVFAARKAVAVFAAAPTVKLTQMTHDLHVSEVSHYRRQGRMKFWLNEDHLPLDWPIRQRPDAILRDENGKIVHAVVATIRRSD